jgi:hypothetical protein
MPDRTAVDALARFGAHHGKNAPAWLRSASRYGLGSEETEPLPIVDVDKSAGRSRRARVMVENRSVPILVGRRSVRKQNLTIHKVEVPGFIGFVGNFER